MITKKELLELIKTGEGYTLEFKENFSSSIGKEMCAFANASGGKILLGVRDDNSIKGFTLTNKVNSEIQNIIKNIVPKIDILIKFVEDITIIHVPEGFEKPYAINGEFYLRQGANSQKLVRDEILEFFRNSNKISFEKQINTNFNLKTDFDKEKFKVFVKKANITDSLPVEHILNNLNLMTNNKPNNACALLFPNRVTKFFLNGDISCVLYQGESKANMLDKKVFDSDFLSNFENAVLFVQRNTKTKAEIKGLERVEEPEIPEKALRESIINAMIHKDYFLEGRILIEIFSNRVEIANPGKLLFDEKELGKVSMTRNPIITDCILRTRLVEKVGSGISRIRELVPSVKFEISSNWFRVVFQRLPVKDAGENAGENAGEKLSELQIKILNLLKKDKTLSAEKISKIFEKDIRTIERNIKKLSEKGIITRVGGAKGGYWDQK